jgi:hypothetical protein
VSPRNRWNSVASTTTAISCPWRVAIYGPFGCRGLKKLDKPLFRFLHLPPHGRLQACLDRIHLYYLSRTWQLAGKALLAWAVALSEGNCLNGVSGSLGYPRSFASLACRPELIGWLVIPGVGRGWLPDRPGR